MRIALVLIFLLCGIGMTFGAELNQRKEESYTAKQHAQHIQYGSEKNTLFVNVRTQNDDRKTENNEKHWYDDLDKNRFLFVVAILQLLVFGWQAICLGRTIKCTQKSERPYIFAEPVGYSMEIDGEIAEWKCNYIIKNLGKTPAIVISKNVFIWLITDGDFPAFQTIKKKDIPDGGFVIKSNEDRSFTCGPKAIDDIETAKEIEYRGNMDKLFCIGQIEYKDIFGKKHFTEFQWGFWSSATTNRGFYLTPNNKLNRYT